MRIAIGSDHRGVDIKHRLMEKLTGIGYSTEGFGQDEATDNDYPDVAEAVGHQVATHEADLGILICGTGIGMSIAANKIHGIRAANCHDEKTAELSRRHNDANVLCIACNLDPTEADKLVKTWLEAEFEGGRHARRVGKIMAIEGKEDQ